MVPRWKLQCASTGVLIIPGIWNTPVHVATDMSRCNAFVFCFFLNYTIRKKKTKILTNFSNEREDSDL